MYKSDNLLQKGLDILFLLAQGDTPLTAQEIAKSLRVPVSTMYRLVEVLVRNELLEKTSRDGHLVLGKRNLLIARGVNAQNILVKAAYPEMKELHAATNEAIHLDVIVGNNKLCIEAIESTAPIRFVSAKWRSTPLNAGASGKVLLAFLPQAEQLKAIGATNLTKMTPKTMTDQTALLRELEEIKRRGYAHTKSEVIEGAEGIAAPIFDWNERIVASLTLTAPQFRMERRNVDEIIEMIKAAAARISASLQQL